MYQSKIYHVYILASSRNGTLYIGITSNLVKIIWEHKNKVIEGFTKEYGVDKLVYCEMTNDINAALLREKQLKKWNRQWKMELIEKENPDWVDLATEYYKKRK